MASSADQANKRKNTGISILAGIGYAIAGFLLGTAIPALTIYLFFEVGTGMCFESCFFGMYFLSPFIGLCMALIGGILGGRRIHKRLSEKK